jgi:uncharacterized protein YndB with AHSA1/START domain
MSHHPVSVSRHIAASPAAIFDLLADPRQHAAFDGSGMLQGNRGGPERLALGDRFSTDIKALRIPYRATCEVSELEPDVRIAWRPWARVAGRRVMGGVTWRYELAPDGDGTLVTETYDVTTGRASHLFAWVGFPTRMQVAMTHTLENLAELVAADHY